MRKLILALPAAAILLAAGVLLAESGGLLAGTGAAPDAPTADVGPKASNPVATGWQETGKGDLSKP